MPTRREQKSRTRRAIVAAALELLDGTSLASLSLRQVARRVGIVPTAFYRHFPDMDALGLTLVDESFVSLRAMLRDARQDGEYGDLINRSVDVLVAHVTDNREHFAFIARERLGGVEPVEQAIAHQLELLVSELALDLSRLEFLTGWRRDDLLMVADVFVRLMVSTAEQVLAALPPVAASDPDAEDDDADPATTSDPDADARAMRTAADLEAIADAARDRLRLIVVGIAGWRSA